MILAFPFSVQGGLARVTDYLVGLLQDVLRRALPIHVHTISQDVAYVGRGGFLESHCETCHTVRLPHTRATHAQGHTVWHKRRSTVACESSEITNGLII